MPEKRQGRTSRFELTVTGKVALTFLVIAFCGMLLEGNNPALFVISCLLATLLVSMVLTFFATGHLTVRRSLPARVFAGASFDVRLEVKNVSRWRPGLGLRFKDRFQISKPGEFTVGPTLPVLPPRSTVEVSYPKRLHRRGIYPVSNFVAASSFPFALFERRVLLRAEPQQLIVLPALGRLRRAGRRALAAGAMQPHSGRHNREGLEEFHSLREYRRGDNPRHVHWKTSARTRTLMRRVMQDEPAEELHIVLDTCTDGMHGDQRRQNLERAISCAATLLVDSARRGRRTTVHFADGRCRHTGSQRGVIPALEILAGVHGGTTRVERVLRQISVRQASRVLVLSLLGPASGAREACAKRGFRAHVWDTGHDDFGKLFTRR